MFRDPADLDVTFRFAEVSALLGNFESAVSALERMLLFNPDLPRVRLELGVLYFRLGSYALARTYLTRALESEDVPTEVQARVEVFLAEIDERLSPHQFSGSIYSGLRYQSNANSGPSSTAVRAAGVDAVLDSQFTRKSDGNVFVSGNVQYLFDTQTQEATVWETTGFFYVTEQEREDQVDLLLFALDVGPRASLPSDLVPGASVRPYLTTDQIWLGKSHFLQSVGIGVTVDKQYPGNASTEIDFRFRIRDFESNSANATATGQNGAETQLRIGGNYVPAERWTLGGFGQVRKQEAKKDKNGNIEYLLSVTAARNYVAPFALTDAPWTSSFTTSLAYTRYDVPDPLVDPGKTRREHEYRMNFLTAVPISNDWTIIGTLARTVQDANLANFRFRNNAATIGASWRF